MSDKLSADRRDSTRVRVDLLVDEHTGGATYFHRASDLSLGGVFLPATLPHAPGTPVELYLRLPAESAPIHVRGVVAGSERDRGMAIQFTDLRTGDMVKIAECIFGEADQS